MDEGRYREAERALWDEAGVVPTEQRVRLSRNDVEVRVLEAGEGPPVLFLHGGPGATGAIWADLAARLPQFRCLLLDRPGTGLSDPQPLPDAAAVRRQAQTLVADVLDALDIDQAHLVGSSHGSYVALLSAAAAPDRVGRTVHLGCPGFVEGMRVTAFDRLVLLPGARHVFTKFPPSERGVHSTFRQLGHGKSLAAGGISAAMIAWAMAVQRHTDTMHHEFAAMAAMGSFRKGFDPSLTIGRELLATVRSPSYFLWGADEVYGDESVAWGVADAMPSAQLEFLPDAGHLCWFDDVEHAAGIVRTHLAA
jgi:2-hydroxy-6-oxonona-2,4-dienedioate hydrolase